MRKLLAFSKHLLCSRLFSSVLLLSADHQLSCTKLNWGAIYFWCCRINHHHQFLYFLPFFLFFFLSFCLPFFTHIWFCTDWLSKAVQSEPAVLYVFAPVVIITKHCQQYSGYRPEQIRVIAGKASTLASAAAAEAFFAVFFCCWPSDDELLSFSFSNSIYFSLSLSLSSPLSPTDTTPLSIPCESVWPSSEPLCTSSSSGSARRCSPCRRWSSRERWSSACRTKHWRTALPSAPFAFSSGQTAIPGSRG